MEIKCVIYDCDGVLFDSLEANRTLYNTLSGLVGRPAITEEELNYVHCHTVFEAVRFIFGARDSLEQRALELLKQIDFTDYIRFLTMEPGLLETLSRLKEKGIHRAISTNRTTSMPHVMERFGLRPYFDMVVTALDVKSPKPDPESILKILQKFKLDKAETLFIGDSEVDHQTARSAGVRFIAYKNRTIADDLYIDSHPALLSLIKEEA